MASRNNLAVLILESSAEEKKRSDEWYMVGLHLVQLPESFFLTRLVKKKKLKFAFPKTHTQYQNCTYILCFNGVSPWGRMRSSWHALEGLNGFNRQLLLKLPKVNSLAFEKGNFLPSTVKSAD